MTRLFENSADRSSQEFGQYESPTAHPQQLMVGPYRAGKTVSLIDEIIRFCNDRPFGTALVVVPSHRYRILFEQRLEERLQEQIKLKQAPSGLFGLHILPFYKACEYVLRKSGRAFRLIPEPVRAAVIARVVAQLQNQGKIQTLDPIIHFAGSHSSLLDLIDELQRAALLPDEVLAKLEVTAQSESRRIELAHIYQGYCQELERLNLVDERGMAFIARSLLSQKSRLNFGMVAADGFDRFNFLQLHVLKGLSQHAERTRLCFDYVLEADDTDAEYAWKASSFQEIKSVFHDAEIRRIEPTTARETVPVVAQDKRVVSISRSLDIFFEAADAVREIKRRIVDGASPEQFVVVARDISRYGPAIRAAFESAEVGYFLDEAVQLTSLPSVQLILRLCELATLRRYKRSEVIACLRSSNFRKSVLCEPGRDIDRLDRFSLENRVVESSQQWLEMIAAHNDKLSSSFRTAFAKFLAEMQPPASGYLRDFVVWIEDILDKYFAVSPDSGEDPFARWEEHKALAEFRRCLANLIHEHNLCGPSTCTPEHFLLRLRTLVERSNFRRQPRQSEYVTVCGADLAPNKLYEYVFVLGMTEGQFPKPVRQGGFLSSDEISAWLSFGIDLRNPRYHSAFESALFKSLVQRARISAHLSFPSFDLGGDELVPSFLVTGGREDASIPKVSLLKSSLTLPVSARDCITAKLWHEPQTDVADLKVMLPLTNLAESLEEPLLVVRARSMAESAVNFNGDLRELAATGIISVSTPAYWSASKLNDYGKCPFRYWASHVVGAEPQEEPEVGLDPRTLGTTFHKALELFYRTLLARNLNLATLEPEEAMRLLQSSVNAALALLQQTPEFRSGEFWQYEKKEIGFRLQRFLMKEQQRAQQDQDQFVPLMTEPSFGSHEMPSSPPLRIRFKDRDVLIRGRIDRIDVAKNSMESGSARVRLIDYKTGSSAITKDDAWSGRNIQLPLYALAVERSIVPNSKVAEAAYLSVSSGESVGRLSFEKKDKQRDGEPRELLQVVEHHVRNFVAGIESGDFSVRPNHKSVCPNCIHKTVCRLSELPDVWADRTPDAGETGLLNMAPPIPQRALFAPPQSDFAPPSATDSTTSPTGSGNSNISGAY